MNLDLNRETKKKLMKWLVALVTICILIFLGIQNIDVVASVASWCVKISLPLLIGAAIAIIVNVPMCFLETYLWKNSKKRFLNSIRRPLAFIISVLFILGCLVGIFWVVIPELVDSVKIIVQGAVDLVTKFDVMTDEELAEIPFGQYLKLVDWHTLYTNLQNWIKDQSSNIFKGAMGTIGSIIGGIFDFIVAFIFAIYLLFSKDKIKNGASRLVRVWLPSRYAEWLIHASSVLRVTFRNFISGQTLEALILGVLCMIGMLLFKFPYAPMVSILVGITALIPVVGGFIGGGIGGFMILTTDTSLVIPFLIFLVVLQQIEGNVIYPKVMGRKVHLPGLWILIAVTLGGGIGGPLGMLLGVPLTSTAYVLIKEATDKRAEMLGMPPSDSTPETSREPKPSEDKKSKDTASYDEKSDTRTEDNAKVTGAETIHPATEATNKEKDTEKAETAPADNPKAPKATVSQKPRKKKK